VDFIYGKKVNVKKIVIFESGSDFAAINFVVPWYKSRIPVFLISQCLYICLKNNKYNFNSLKLCFHYPLSPFYQYVCLYTRLLSNSQQNEIVVYFSIIYVYVLLTVVCPFVLFFLLTIVLSVRYNTYLL
jgi:type III secretory pathway component EscU